MFHHTTQNLAYSIDLKKANNRSPLILWFPVFTSTFTLLPSFLNRRRGLSRISSLGLHIRFLRKYASNILLLTPPEILLAIIFIYKCKYVWLSFGLLTRLVFLLSLVSCFWLDFWFLMKSFSFSFRPSSYLHFSGIIAFLAMKRFSFTQFTSQNLS